MRFLLLPLILLPNLALASSEDAWQEFRAKVEESCAALAPTDGKTVIEVNPFGSESYGAALLITSYPDGEAERFVCIFDKVSGATELTAPFPAPAPVAETTVSPEGTISTEITPHSDATILHDAAPKATPRP